MRTVVGDLFSGIGGFALAARWMGWEKAFFSEIEPYAAGVLRQHWPDVPNLGDITRIDWSTINEPIDLLCGGFPCQGISLAGKGHGLKDKRSALWSEFRRAIAALRPPWVVVENVPALRSRGLDVVLGDFLALGYDAEWHCVPASAVGAPHRRDRIWLVAYTCRTGSRKSGESHERENQRAGWDATGVACAGHGRTWALRPYLDVAFGAEAVVDNRFRTGLEGHAGHGANGNGRAPATRPTASASLRRCTEELAHAGGDGRLRQREPEHRKFQGASGDLVDGRSAGRRGHGTRRRTEAEELGNVALGRRGVRGEPSGNARQRVRAGETAEREARAAQSAVGRVLDGVSRRVDLYPALGPGLSAEWPAGPDETPRAWEAPRVTAKNIERRRRLTGLGNAIVPQVAFRVFLAIEAARLDLEN